MSDSPTSHRPLSAVLPDPDAAGAEADQNVKSRQVRQMFNRIAGTYDVLNAWISMGMHNRWKRRACALLQLPKGGRALDVCTGTGDLLGMLLPMVGPTGTVDGLDFSENMLAVAEKRYAGTPNLTLTQGDALALPYPDNTFDGAIISFGLRNVVDIPGALAEMARVIKPGGWMVNLDTSPTPKVPGMKFYFSRIVPLLGNLMARDQQAYAYLSESTQHFLKPDTLRQLFESAGLVNVSSNTLMFGSVNLQAGQKPL